MKKRFLVIVIATFVLMTTGLSAQVKDKIFLRDGQVLTGFLINPTFDFGTIYGDVAVPNDAARTIEMVSDRIEVLNTVNDEKITGYILNEYLELSISGGPRIQVRKELIKKIVFAPRDGPRVRMNDYFMMKNGDIFYGEVLDRSFEFTTSYGTVNTSFSDLLKLEDQEGQTKMYLADGNTMMGYISTNYITIETNYGFNMRIPKSSIKLIQMR